MKIIFIMTLSLLIITLYAYSASSDDLYDGSHSIHQFTMKTLDNDDFAFSQLKGNVLLIVNVASKCGFTEQYRDLQTLYETYGKKGLVVIGIPSNDFGEQEPGSNEEIKSFCTLNYRVTFPMLEKSIVKGENAAPLYQFLTNKRIHPKTGGRITWNFNKFIVDKNGFVVKRFSSFVRPTSKKITQVIDTLLENQLLEDSTSHGTL
jgi:glutathione peroxidase